MWGYLGVGMGLKKIARILDSKDIQNAIIRISHQILERNKETDLMAIVGIRTRGEYLARRIVDQIQAIDRKIIPLGILDITLYRDDLTQVSEQPVVKETQIDFDINGRCIILVDDVLFTGRTVRCAMDALVDFGRPKMIQLAVLIDRGHRELPIKPDFVGKNVPTSLKQVVEVRLLETDGEDEVVICEGDA